MMRNFKMKKLLQKAFNGIKQIPITVLLSMLVLIITIVAISITAPTFMIAVGIPLIIGASIVRIIVWIINRTI